MNTRGIQLQVLIGSTVPVPVPPSIANAIDEVEVSHGEVGRSGFQITLHIAPDMLEESQLEVNQRVVLSVLLDGVPHVLIDGWTTHQEFQPGGPDAHSVLLLTGEDVSLAIDRDVRSRTHPGQAESVIAMKILSEYAHLGIMPVVIPPSLLNTPVPTDKVPVQAGTDLEYLGELAARHGFVFYLLPGPAPLVNTAYWGPPLRTGIPQPALTVGTGPHGNVERIDFRNDAERPSVYAAHVQDRRTNEVREVRTRKSDRSALASTPTLGRSPAHLRTRSLDTGGLTVQEAEARAQALTDQSADEVVTADGELDALRYGQLLQPRGLVELRGAGAAFDGKYFVKRVTHSLRRGSYRQSFTLARGGLGSTVERVHV